MKTIRDHWEDVEFFDCGYATECAFLPVKPDDKGYVRLRLGSLGRVRAHRATYEEFIGLIPAELTLDHLCRVRACVNPWHLESVSNIANVMRGESPPAKLAQQTHCLRGHLLMGANLIVETKGHRRCRKCAAAAAKNRYWKNPELKRERERVKYRRLRGEKEKT